MGAPYIYDISRLRVKDDFKSSHYSASNGWMLVNNVLQIMYKEVVFG